MQVQVFASGSSGNCYQISDGETSLLLECGIPYKAIQEHTGYRVSSLAGCLISHEHGDHARAVTDMMKTGVDCYMSAGTANALKVAGHHRAKIISSHRPVTIETMTVLPFDTQHDCEEPLGFLIASKAGDKLLFITDTQYVKYRFTGITTLMIECNYSMEILQRNVRSGLLPAALKDRIICSHFGLESVLDFLASTDTTALRETFLIHLSNGNSDAAQFQKAVQQVTGRPVHIA